MEIESIEPKFKVGETAYIMRFFLRLKKLPSRILLLLYSM